MLTALALASREAILNAQRHAGVDRVSVFTEVEPDAVRVYVRDRGTGMAVLAPPVAETSNLMIGARFDLAHGRYARRRTQQSLSQDAQPWHPRRHARGRSLGASERRSETTA